MRSIKIDPLALGLSPEDVAIAGRVAMAIHRHAIETYQGPHGRNGGRADAARKATCDALLRAGGWSTIRDRRAAFIRWLRETRRTDMSACIAKRCEIDGVPPSKGRKTSTWEIITHLEQQGLVRYVRGDRWDGGLIVWIGDDA